MQNTIGILKDLLIYVKGIEPDYSKWYAGISSNLVDIEKDINFIYDVSYFKSWNFGSKNSARNIETLLQKNNFKKENQELATLIALESLRNDSTYVHVYLKNNRE